jgi:hypothetical protein
MSTEAQFKELLSNFLEGRASSLKDSAVALSAYANELAVQVAASAGQPGFNYAVEAARDSFMLKAAEMATVEADAADEALVGFITGLIGMGAKALAA